MRRFNWVALPIALIAPLIAGYNARHSRMQGYLDSCQRRLDAEVERVEESRGQVEAWKRLYLQADSDAKYVNCVSLDNNFVVCEKPRHVKER
jgi:hypothetical protein